MQDLIYNDSTPMPFGQHKGIKLANVPSEYLFYLWNVSGNGVRLSDAKLATYIRDNLHVIEIQAVKEKQNKFYERR